MLVFRIGFNQCSYDLNKTKDPLVLYEMEMAKQNIALYID